LHYDDFAALNWIAVATTCKYHCPSKRDVDEKGKETPNDSHRWR